MPKEIPKKLVQDKPSALGNFLYKMDRRMHNTKFYIKRHSISIEMLFLLVYTGLNLGLIYLIRERIVSVFIIFLLLALSLERLILHLKSRIDKEVLDKKERQIKEEVSLSYDKLDTYIFEIEKRNRSLEKKNYALTFKAEGKLKNKR